MIRHYRFVEEDLFDQFNQRTHHLRINQITTTAMSVWVGT